MTFFKYLINIIYILLYFAKKNLTKSKGMIFFFNIILIFFMYRKSNILLEVFENYNKIKSGSLVETILLVMQYVELRNLYVII